MLAFPCRVWSPLQHLTTASAPNAMVRQQRKKRQRLAKLKEKKLVKYTVKKARDQVAEGRHFLVENPAGSQAWQDVPEMKELCEDEDVYSVVVDMCQFGLRGPGGGLHKKATRLLTSSEELYKELSAVPRCSGNHWHEHVMGGSRVTELAGHYTQEFSEAVIRGAQKRSLTSFSSRLRRLWWPSRTKSRRRLRIPCQKTRKIPMVMVQIKCMPCTNASDTSTRCPPGVGLNPRHNAKATRLDRAHCSGSLAYPPR